MKTFVLGSLVLLLAACGRPGSDPAAVTEAFWRAAQEGDADAARAHALESEGTSLSDDGAAQIESFAIGSTTYENEQARVQTTIEGMKGAPAVVQFATVLVEHEGDWKVDVGATANDMMQSVFGVSMEDMAEQMGEALAEGMGNAMKGMAEGLADGVQAMGEAMAEAIEDVGVSADQSRSLRTDEPFETADTGTVDPGMREAEVVARWGQPVERTSQERHTYLFYRNGCEASCGTYDLVILLDGQVVDAIVRHPGHRYSGVSSSPQSREPAFSPPTKTSS